MKKIFTCISAAVLALGLQAAATLDTIQVDGIYYQINEEDSIATLIRYNASSKYEIEDIVIPVDVVKDEIPYPVVALGQGALRNTTAKTITFAKGSKVTELGMQAFQAAVNVQELELPEGIKLIPLSSIHNATATNPMQMKKLVLPASIDSIVRLSICLPQLKSLEFKGTVPPRINTFATPSGYTQNPWEVNKDNACNTAKSAIVIVPKGSVEAYRNTEWIGDYFTVIVDAKKDTIEVDGLFYEMDNTKQTATLIPAQNSANKYEQDNIVIPATVSEGGREYPVVSLAKAAFKQSPATSITFAESSNVVEIGMRCFQRATNITELELPEGIKLIPVTAIHSDQDPATEPMALEKLVLPASVDSLAMMSVVASNLTTIEFKGSVPPGCCHKYIAATDYYQIPWEINKTHKNFTPKECVIIVPKGALEAYQNAPGIGDYFTTIKEQETTAVENTAVQAKAVQKHIVNGQLLIERDGKIYTVTGAQIR